MRQLIKKEIALCVHPTGYIFLSFALLTFVPNYPYEMIFFFSCLSVFFCCLTARENGDVAFTCALPVKKRLVPIARILTMSGFQCVLLVLTGAVGAIKGAAVPAEMYLNYAGLSANIALLGNAAIVLGTFNLVFFAGYYKNPEKVGIPFVAGGALVVLLIGIFIVLRWTVPFFMQTLNGLNSENAPFKALWLLIGLMVYAVLTAAACKISANRFEKTDI